MYRESRDKSGNLNYINNHEDIIKIISDMLVYDIIGKRTVKIGDLFST